MTQRNRERVICFVILLHIVYQSSQALDLGELDNIVQLNTNLEILNRTMMTKLNVLNQAMDTLSMENNALKKDVEMLKANMTKRKAVAFSAALSHNTQLGQNQIVQFDHVITNIGNAYDPRIGHFVAPVKGIYLLSLTALSIYHQKLHLQMVKNGVELIRGEAETSEADTTTVIVMTLLEVNDFVWVRHFTGYSTESIVGSLWSVFSGTLIETIV